MTLVTQCSADRLPLVLKQALRWGGDISLAVLVPSAPAFEVSKVRLAEIDHEMALKEGCGGRSGSPIYSHDIAAVSAAL